MSFKWIPDMQVDNGQVDEDHKKLISLANRVLLLDRPNRDAEEMKRIIRELYDYVKYHFDREEKFMREIKYPAVDEHHERHHHIIADMNHHLTQSHHMSEILSNFRQLVNKWVINHIMEEDLKIKDFMANQKPTPPSQN